MVFNNQNPNYARYEGESLIAIVKNPSPIKTVFLSSTFEDLREYIERVQTYIQRAGVFCSTQSWVTTFISTIDECRKRLDESDAYVGIFAYWYGSIPPNSQQSITHLEFNWAKQKWNGHDPPIAIFMPEELSEAGNFLKEKALQLVSKDTIEPKYHDSCLKLFHQEVNQWRMITPFKDLTDLCANVSIICKQWAGLTFLEAARDNIEITEKNLFKRKVTGEELGLLGREKQLAALKKIINKVPDFPNVPAIALVVSSNKNAGQDEFIQHITRRKKIKGRPPQVGRPQVEQYGLDLLVQWAGESLGVVFEGQEANSLAELARIIYDELQNQNLCLILDEIHRYIGDVPAFYKDFWMPLYKELEKLQRQKQAENQLVVIIVDYADKSNQWTAITKEFISAGELTEADYSKLFLLKLTPITRDDLMDWFEEVEVPVGKRSYFANVVLKDPDGQIDNTPQEVFRKLRKEDLWKE